MTEVSEAAQTQDGPVALFKKRGNKAKAAVRKRPTTAHAANDSSSESFTEDEDGGRKVKRRRRGGLNVEPSRQHGIDAEDLQAPKFSAETSTSIQTTTDATKQSNWYDEEAPEALSAKKLLGKSRTSDLPGTQQSGSYKGIANYSSFIQKNPNAPSRQMGPVKAPTNVRTITVTDYAPDVCKDYKQTGFCGFGDSCKFLHAREDYKQGWQLDKDWEIGDKGKKTSGAKSKQNGQVEDEDGEDALLENIPFACIICKKPYQNPIVTKCNHYFCEQCALDRYRKNPACAACGASTGGVFNGARNLERLLEKKRARTKENDEDSEEKAEMV